MKKLNKKLFYLKIQSTGSDQLWLLPLNCSKKPALKIFLSEEILGFSGEKSMECDTGCKLWWSVEQAGGRTLPLIVQSILHHPPQQFLLHVASSSG